MNFPSGDFGRLTTDHPVVVLNHVKRVPCHVSYFDFPSDRYAYTNYEGAMVYFETWRVWSRVDSSRRLYFDFDPPACSFVFNSGECPLYVRLYMFGYSLGRVSVYQFGVPGDPWTHRRGAFTVKEVSEICKTLCLSYVQDHPYLELDWKWHYRTNRLFKNQSVDMVSCRSHVDATDNVTNILKWEATTCG